MGNKIISSVKENSSIILIFFILLSILFKITGFSIASDFLLWGIYALFAIIFISFLIQANSKNLEIPGKIIIVFIPFLPLFNFMDDFLLKVILSLSIVIIYLISSNRIKWLNNKNWQYSFLVIFLYIISVVFSFVSLRYAGNTDLKILDELSSPNHKNKLITKREISGSAVGNTYVYLEKNYFNLIKKSEVKHSSSWTGLPVLQWVNDKEYKIGHKEFKIK